MSKKFTRNRPSPVEDAILEIINKTTEPISVLDIYEPIKSITTEASVRTILARMVQDGLICNDGWGIYKRIN